MLRVIILVILCCCNVTSAANFYQKKAQGWHWYEQPLQQEHLLEQDSMPDASSEIKELRQELESKLNEAIVRPTRENVTQYMRAQKRLMDLSQNFAVSWQKVLFTTPELDETIKNPVTQAARHVYLDSESLRVSNKIKSISKEYGLLFFFRKNCAYCHEFASTVKRFSDKYNWEVLPISLDGGKLAEFPNARQDNGIAAQMKINAVPALIAVHPASKKLIPVAYGMIAIDEMERRIDVLTEAARGL